MDHSQLLDAVGMQEQVELIVHSSLQDMKQDHVRQVMRLCKKDNKMAIFKFLYLHTS